MKLPIPSLFDKKPTTEYFLALLLRDEKASAVVIEEQAGKIKIIGKHEEKFSTEIENAPDSEWLTILDKTISKAEETLPPNIETHKTVFGVKDSWITEKKIKKEYLLRLKKVCDNLTLSPIGFLVISEAIVHLIQVEEGAPLSAILCEIGIMNITITLYRAGKILETYTATITESIPNTVDTLLKSVTAAAVLPARIIIFDGAHKEDLGQQFISHQWSKSLPFLHMPQISVLPAGFDAKAIVFSAASELGFEVLGAIIDKTNNEIKTYDQPQVPTPQTASIPEEAHNPPIASEEAPVIIPDDTTNQEKNEATLQNTPSDNFGFVIDQDIATLPHPQTELQSQPVDSAQFSIHKGYPEAMNPTQQVPFTPSRQRPSSKLPFTLPAITPLLRTIVTRIRLLPKPSLALLSGGSKKLLIIPAILLVILGISLYAYFTMLTATVTLAVKTKGLEESPNIIFSLTAPNDFAQNILAAKAVTTSLDGAATTNATGKKDIGNKAKGNVTIYNSDTAKKSLTEGTTITSSNNLIFVLDKDISIASASGDIFSGTKPGTTSVAVTAKTIGNESNLPSNTKFTIGTSTSLAAKNDSAFSGGSKKTITVIAKADIDRITADLPKSLESKAKEELAKKAADGETVVPFITSVTLEKKKLDKNIDDEAKTVTLKATATFSAAAYTNDSLKEYSQAFLKNKFSQDLTISEKGITNTVTNLKVKSEKEISATLHIKAGLLPKLNTDKISADLAGKSFVNATEITAKLPQVDHAEFTLSPNLFFLPRILPQSDKNITVKIAAYD